jgi:hypothetical protein
VVLAVLEETAVLLGTQEIQVLRVTQEQQAIQEIME